MNNELMFSSNSEEWETPKWLFDYLDKKFNFNIDVCASINNNLCRYYYNKTISCLENEWYIDYLNKTKSNLNTITCFMNPPYGRKIIHFVKKAYEESLKKCVIVCLLPARTDTKWFHEYCIKAAEIWFLKGRLKFGNNKNSAPFPSCIVVFDHDLRKWHQNDMLRTKYIDLKNIK